MAIPLVAAATIAGKVTKLVGGLFKGQSAAFQQREAINAQFFALRQAIDALRSEMSQEQLAERLNLPDQRADYGTRKANQAEIDALNAFAKKLADPNAWPTSTPLLDSQKAWPVPGTEAKRADYAWAQAFTPGKATQSAVIQAGFGGSWIILAVAAAFLLPMLLKKK
jgi:hypothetical protein